jgi:hypothetical protein
MPFFLHYQNREIHWLSGYLTTGIPFFSSISPPTPSFQSSLISKLLPPVKEIDHMRRIGMGRTAIFLKNSAETVDTGANSNAAFKGWPESRQGSFYHFSDVPFKVLNFIENLIQQAVAGCFPIIGNNRYANIGFTIILDSDKVSCPEDVDNNHTRLKLLYLYFMGRE